MPIRHRAGHQLNAGGERRHRAGNLTGRRPPRHPGVVAAICTAAAAPSVGHQRHRQGTGKTRAHAKVIGMIMFVRGGTGRQFNDSDSRTQNVTAGSEANKSDRDRSIGARGGGRLDNAGSRSGFPVLYRQVGRPALWERRHVRGGRDVCGELKNADAVMPGDARSARRATCRGRLSSLPPTAAPVLCTVPAAAATRAGRAG